MKSLAYSRKTSYLCNQEKKVFAGCPDAPASTLKKITASSDGMPLPEFVFLCPIKNNKGRKASWPNVL